MLDTVSKFVPVFGRSLYREFVIFLGGFSGVVFLFTVTGHMVTIFEASLYAGGRIEFGILVILLSYIGGKLIDLITEFVTYVLYWIVRFVCYVFLDSRHNPWQLIRGTVLRTRGITRDKLRQMILRGGKPEYVNRHEVVDMITLLEFAEMEEKYPSIREFVERGDIRMIILRFFCFYAFLCVVLNLKYSLIILCGGLAALYVAYLRKIFLSTEVNQSIAKMHFTTREKSH